jgi:hypothetical protein
MVLHYEWQWYYYSWLGCYKIQKKYMWSFLNINANFGELDIIKSIVY